MSRIHVNWSVVLASFSAISLVLWTRWRRKLEIVRRKKKKKDSSINIGGIFGLDVGGTLTKIVYFEKDLIDKKPVFPSAYPMKRSGSLQHLEAPDHQEALQQLYSQMESSRGQKNKVITRDEHLAFHSNKLGGRLHFLRFETRNIIDAIDMLASTSLTENIRSMCCTGGGAHKYSKEVAKKLDITVHQMDELKCLIRGMHFALTNVVDECYAYRPRGDFVLKPDHKQPVWQKDTQKDLRKVQMSYTAFTSSKPFPYLVVNIGSGVSILKVTAEGQFERVSGTSVGGGTYWGLCRLLTRCSSYEEVLDIAESGDASEIDMLVKDIYGHGYDAMNLPGNMVASSFGKLVMKERPAEGIKEEDIAIALLMMITNNIGQVAYLNAKLHGCSTIFFVGNFLRHNSISCRRLAFAINFWSNGEMEALFLEHEGYFGALGTFLERAIGSQRGDEEYCISTPE